MRIRFSSFFDTYFIPALPYKDINIPIIQRTLGLPQDKRWQVKYRKMNAAIAQANIGDVYFMEISSYPLASVLIKVVSIDQNTRERNTEMIFVSQMTWFPKKPGNVDDIMRAGYKLHKRRITQSVGTELENNKMMTWTKYKYYHIAVLNLIDRCIHKNHGVQCQQNGQIDEHRLDNTFFLHICDVINLFVTQELNLKIPELVLATHWLRHIPENISNMLKGRVMNTTQCKFLLEEADHIYCCYAYYSNFSFIPIRLRVHTSNPVLRDLAIFMNAEEFINHQKGKMQELNRYNMQDIAKVYYRSV
jgi:hypothetical protein